MNVVRIPERRRGDVVIPPVPRSLSEMVVPAAECERADGGSLKNVAERGDRRLGDRDPSGVRQDEYRGARFFRLVEPEAAGTTTSLSERGALEEADVTSAALRDPR